MNKGITLLILFVVLSAMGLVLYSYSTAEKPAGPEDAPRLAAYNGSGADRNAAPSGTGLRPIDPPLSSNLGTPPANGSDTAPLRLTPGDNGRGTAPQTRQPDPTERQTPSAQNATPPAASGSGTTAATTPPAAATGAKPDTPASTQPARTETPAERSGSGSPGLTPWTGAGQAETPAAGTAATSTAASTPPPTTTARPAADNKPLSLTGKHSLSAISLGGGNDLRLRIEGGDPFPCKTFVLTNPDRLVIDLPGTWTGMKAPAVPQNALVKAVRLGQQPAGPRLVLDLNRKLKNHSVDRNGNTVEIRLQ